jgi:hypothetical protein
VSPLPALPADPTAFRPTPIFDELDRWARDATSGGSMLSFGGAERPTPGRARTVLALLAAAREERTARHALRRT